MLECHEIVLFSIFKKGANSVKYSIALKEFVDTKELTTLFLIKETVRNGKTA